MGPPPAEPRINWFRSSELEPGTAFDEHRVEEQVRALLERRAEGHKLAVVPTEASPESKTLSPRKEVSAEEHRQSEVVAAVQAYFSGVLRLRRTTAFQTSRYLFDAPLNKLSNAPNGIANGVIATPERQFFRSVLCKHWTTPARKLRTAAQESSAFAEFESTNEHEDNASTPSRAPFQDSVCV